MNLKNILVTIFVTAALSAAVTRYYFPKTVVKVEEKQVIKKDIRTVIREVKGKDGTTVTETEIIDNSTERRDKTREVFARKDWVLSTSYGLREFKQEAVYGLQVQRRIIGPFYLGASATADKVYSFTLGMEF